MKLYTCQMARWREATKLGIPFLDVTVKSGDKTFSPSWALLQEYKRTFDEGYYTEKFYQLMRESYKSNPLRWKEVLEGETLAIGCYCAKGKFCHRKLLVEIFEKVGNNLGIEFIYEGEL